MLDWARERYPKEPGDSDFVYKQTIKAKACDAVRGILPAATLSNVGIYGTGQALRGAAAAHARPPAARGADATRELMLEELRKVIPSFLTRVDRPDRGGAWTAYLARDPRPTPPTSSHRLFGDDEPEPAARRHARSTSTPRAKTRCSRRSATRTRTCPRTSCSTGCARSAPTTASRCCTRTSASAPTGGTSPGRAFERTDYRFDVLADYGAFRDLQRHRMLTIEWQPLHPRHGYDVPGAGRRSRARRRASTRRWNVRPRCTTRWPIRFPEQASYAVSLAYRMRFVMQMNAREAMHLSSCAARRRATRRTGASRRRCTG